MSYLSTINTQTDWLTACKTINENYSKISVDIEKLKSATTKNKGYFKTLEDLKAAYTSTNSTVGMIAYVGTTSPYKIYEYKSSGWTDTGNTHTSSVSLGDYYDKAEVDTKLTELFYIIEKLESELYDEGDIGDVFYKDTVDSLGSYKVNYFNSLKTYESGFILDSFLSESIFAFYFVKSDGKTDTSHLVNKESLPYTLPNDVIGLAAKQAGSVQLTFKTTGIQEISKIENILNDLNEAKSELSYIKSMLPEEEIIKPTIQGCVTSDGTISNTSAAVRTDYLPIIKGMKLENFYDGSSQYPTYRAFAFFNKDKAFISVVDFDTAGQKDITLNDENIPNEASFIIGSTLKGKENDASVIISWFSKIDENTQTLSGLEDTIRNISENIEKIKSDLYEKSDLEIKENVVLSGGYAKAYFERTYPMNTILSVLTFEGAGSFYFVKDDNTLDTSKLIRETDIPYTIAENVIGIAGNIAGAAHLTFTVKGQTISRVEILEEKVSSVESAVNKKQWQGKTILTFGNSITHMIYNSKSYSDIIADITGANVINLGIGGSTFRQRGESSDIVDNWTTAYANLDIINMVKAVVSKDYSKQIATKEYALQHPESTDLNGQLDSIERLLNVDIDNVDAILMSGGTNDFRNVGANLDDEPAGDMSYTGEAIKEIIRLICSYNNENKKDIKLYWFTPIVRWVDPYNFDSYKDYAEKDQVMYDSKRYEFTTAHPRGAWIGTDAKEITPLEGRTDFAWGDNFVNSGGITLKDFCEKIKNLVSSYKIPVCDMYNTLGWNQYNFNKFLMETDGTHPYYGLDYIAYKMFSFVNSNKTF